MKPWKVPVVEDVRAESRKLEAEAKGDLHTYFELLRRSQNRYAQRLVAHLDATTEETGAGAPPHKGPLAALTARQRTHAHRWPSQTDP